MINSEMKIGQIAAEHPLTTRVFARHQIDFCCGGGQLLAEVCQSKNLDLDTIVDEINNELNQKQADDKTWDQATVDELIDHILEKYHVPLYEELPRLLSMANKVKEVHGNKDPIRFENLVSIITKLKDDLEQHMEKEEQILFPLLKTDHPTLLKCPIDAMLREHQDAGEILSELRKLTDNYTAPESACTTWLSLWKGLEVLEEDLHQHIHLENNILFPKGLQKLDEDSEEANK